MSAIICNTSESGIKHTTPVGHFREPGRSVYGCDDMAGNVWEWTESSYNESEDWCVVRGGSWNNSHGRAACAYRNYLSPDYRDKLNGFRCART